MGIKLHPDYYGGYTDLNTKALYETSRKVSATIGIDVQVNKAITGENAFAHSSGIHQDGLLKSKDVYEIIAPETIGAPPMELVLTARSGRHAFTHITKKLGYEISESQLPCVYEAFLQMADQKKEVYDSDVISLMEGFKEVKKEHVMPIWHLIDFQVIMNSTMPTATIRLKQKEEVMVSKTGTGAIDALYSAIFEAVDLPIQLMDYRIHSLSHGKESLGKVSIEIEYEGKIYQGKAIEKDVIKASAVALINGINKISR